MGNIFGAIVNGAMDSIKSPLKVGKSLTKGDFKGAFDDLKHIPGNQERANSEIFNSVGIRGSLGDKPWMAPAAVFGGIYGAGAMGLGAAGGGALSTGGALGASGTGATSAGALMGSGSALSAPVGFGTGASGSAAFGTGATSTGSLFNAGTAGTLGSNGGLGGAGGSAFTMENTMNILKTASSIAGQKKQQEQQILQASPVRTRGVQFDSKLFENKELTKAYNELYYGPSNT